MRRASSARSPVAAIDLDYLLGLAAKRSPEMEAVWRFMQEEDRKLPPQAGMSVQEQRAQAALRNRRWNNGEPPVADVRRLSVPGLDGAPDLLCDLYTPADAAPGCALYIHGGGWVNGSIDSLTRIPRTLANALGTRVLNVEYRLAPEHPFPAGLRDCVAAWRWLAAPRAGNDTSSDETAFAGPLAIAGDSAGANLAVAVMLHESQAGLRLPDCGLLFYGVYGCDFDTPSYRRFGDGHGLMRAGMERFVEMYAPGGDGPDALRRDPLVSPMFASQAQMARLPPLYLNAAGLDPLLCDSINFARRIEAAGVEYAIDVIEGVHHGFMQITERLPQARRAFDLSSAFFRAASG